MFMKTFVVHINRLPRWSSCLKEPICTSLPWCLILSNSIRGVKNVSSLSAVLIHPIIKSWSFRGWGLDFIVKINPLSSKRHCFVLVAIDYSTKWTEAILLKNMIHSRIGVSSSLGGQTGLMTGQTGLDGQTGWIDRSDRFVQNLQLGFCLHRFSNVNISSHMCNHMPAELEC